MKKLKFFVVLVIFLLLGAIQAQESIEWTCDDGENDVLLAAQAARESGDYDRAWQLAPIAEALCVENLEKYRAARRLRQLHTFTDYLELAGVDVLEINGHGLFVVCYGEGSPTVIFENGFGVGFNESWQDVFPAISSVTKACIYDRYGYGVSRAQRGENLIRTTQDEVDDFITLIEVAELEAPFVIVGHSIAGLNITLLEEQHPELVAGIVLVDASHPEQLERFAEAYPHEANTLGIEEMQNWSFDFPTSFESAQGFRDFGDIPLVVVTAVRNSEEVWFGLQEDYLSFSTNSRQIMAERSDHFIMATEPNLVIGATLWVLQQLEELDATE